MSSICINDSKEVLIDSSCTIITDCSEVNIRYDLKDGEYAILIFNDYKGNVILHDSGRIENADVKINYLQLEAFDLKQDSRVYVEKGSSLSVNSTYLGFGNKDIVREKSDFSMDCIGTIVKGAKRSKCHQSTHCLTMDSPKRARVLPVLNIDENDVEASHSLASGTIDEEILFYMNSRGLNKKEALNLILRSYLMPSDDYYKAFDRGSEIQKRAISKVDEICSM